MKILIVNKFLYPNGGSETYIFEIGRQLTKMGHEVQYFGMEHEGRIVGNHAESYTRDMNFHGSGPDKILYPFRIIYSGEARKKIRIVLNDFKPDVVQIILIFRSLLLLFTKSGSGKRKIREKCLSFTQHMIISGYVPTI